jgi:rfaE bifunctional protein nucleotidyltransferase chain/domain
MLSIEEKTLKETDEFSPLIKKLSRPLVFTNGCFDILHRGHVSYLEEAAQLGNSLIVAVNTDNSVRRQNKGSDRPINLLSDRLALLAALQSVDLVIPFDTDTPLKLIQAIQPDILVKGGDWPIAEIVGAEEVIEHGGEVHSIPFRYQRSTSDLIKRIRS